MKIIFVLFLSFFNGFGQSLEECDLVLIKNNILSFRINYLTKINPSEIYFNHNCLLPPLNWDLKINYSIDNENYEIFKGYEIFKITNFNYSYIKYVDDVNYIIDSSGCGFIDYSDKFIVAKKGKDILFISGMVFKDPIAKFFNLSVKNPESFYKFISIKLNNYNLNDIKFKKYKKGKLLFESSIGSVNDKVLIEIDEMNFDIVSVIFSKPIRTIYLR